MPEKTESQRIERGGKAYERKSLLFRTGFGLHLERLLEETEERALALGRGNWFTLMTAGGAQKMQLASHAFQTMDAFVAEQLLAMGAAKCRAHVYMGRAGNSPI